MIKFATPHGNKEKKITLEDFIEKFNNKEAILVDIRMPYETKVWNIPFAVHIPADELENRLNELPQNKTIVVACPTQNRSPFAAMFLRQNGFNARYLEGGFLNLMAKLKGGEAKKLKIED
jgi:rhodanese-related sulfurtransferase